MLLGVLILFAIARLAVSWEPNRNPDGADQSGKAESGSSELAERVRDSFAPRFSADGADATRTAVTGHCRL